MDEKGAHFNCDPDALDSSLVGLFNGAVNGTWSIHQLERVGIDYSIFAQSKVLEIE